MESAKLTSIELQRARQQITQLEHELEHERGQTQRLALQNASLQEHCQREKAAAWEAVLVARMTAEGVSSGGGYPQAGV